MGEPHQHEIYLNKAVSFIQIIRGLALPLSLEKRSGAQPVGGRVQQNLQERVPLLSEFSRGMSKDGSFQPIARGRLDPDVQTRGRHREEEQAGVRSGPRAPLHISSASPAESRASAACPRNAGRLPRLRKSKDVGSQTNREEPLFVNLHKLDARRIRPTSPERSSATPLPSSNPGLAVRRGGGTEHRSTEPPFLDRLAHPPASGPVVTPLSGRL